MTEAAALPRYIQLHFLTAYGVNCLNRDDLNRPKSVLFGNAPRMRLSSQCVKRAWRTSAIMADVFQQFGRGERTRDMWKDMAKEAIAMGYTEADVVERVKVLREAFEGKSKEAKAAESAAENNAEGGAQTSVEMSPGAASDEAGSAPTPEAEEKTKGKGNKGNARKGRGAKADKKASTGLAMLNADIFYFSAAEVDFIRETLIDSLKKDGSTGGQPPTVEKVRAAMTDLAHSGDVAMFGRMVANNKSLEIEGGVQVSHVFTVNKSVVDDDYFVAVDDRDTNGTAHLGSNGFGSGLYYGHVVVDVQLLLKNLKDNKEFAYKLLKGLAESIATVSPGAKQNSMSACSYATYLMAEYGNAQPRSFADAFLTPVRADELAQEAIKRLKKDLDGLNKAFPKLATKVAEMNRVEQTGSLDSILAHIREALGVVEAQQKDAVVA